MARVEIIPAEIEHVQALLPHVRQADIDEFYAASLSTPEQVLTQGIRVSTLSWSAIFDDQVVAIFGIAPASMLGGDGVPWLVGADMLERYQKTFLRRCRPFVSAMLDVYPHLVNYVDVRNVAAKAWLHWLGFTLEEPKPIGALNYPFHRFTMEKKPCAI
ncbi:MULTISPECIES: hypothetical protein [Pectobacterium]|uniref:hypothetical protein n=1 Tax=Pectobacterium TaxID=122277 RepID=UPI001CD69E89|nr:MULTISPECIES: hypothetical protein [Pectobacterium]UPY96264.1 hypothetical protein MYB54_06030 [Pectobacterium sp. 21LCBS03]